MNSSELETWAVKMAARNRNPFDWITPVLLYRNGKPALSGAYVQMEGGREVVFTAAHGFSIENPSCIWSFRKLIPATQPQRLIAKAIPMRGNDDDVAVCTPASVLQQSSDPSPNFYRGFLRGGYPTFEPRQAVEGTVRSVLTGEDVKLLGEALIDGKLHVALDVEASEGQSGSVFVDETESKMYVLRAYSPALTEAIRAQMPTLKRGVTFAVRLAYA